MKDSWLCPAVTLPHSDRIVMSTDPGGQQKARGMWAFFSAARSHARYSEFCLSSGPKESALERKVRVRSPRRTLGSETHPEAERESEQSSQGKETLCAVTPGDPRGGEGRVQKNSTFGKDFPNPFEVSRSWSDVGFLVSRLISSLWYMEYVLFFQAKQAS